MADLSRLMQDGLCGGMITIFSRLMINFLEAVHRRLSQVNLVSLSRYLLWQNASECTCEVAESLALLYVAVASTGPHVDYPTSLGNSIVGCLCFATGEEGKSTNSSHSFTSFGQNCF